MNHKHDVVLFPTISHLCMYYWYIQNNVHLRLNTYGYIISHILAIDKPQFMIIMKKIKKCTYLTYYTVGVSWF